MEPYIFFGAKQYQRNNTKCVEFANHTFFEAPLYIILCHKQVENHVYCQKLFINELRLQETPGTTASTDCIYKSNIPGKYCMYKYNPALK